MKAERNEIIETKNKEGAEKWRKLKKILIPLFLFLLLISVSGYLTVYAVKDESGIVINEVMSSNSQSFGALRSPDWIELYNGTQTDIDLSGYKIRSSNGSYVFGDTSIKAEGYILVYAAKNITPEEGCCCAGFGIPASGDMICIIDPEGAETDRVSVPALVMDESYARRDDGTFGFCADATPGEANDNADIISEADLQSRLCGSKLTVSEVMPKGKPSWVELYNAGDTEAELEDYCLTDSESDTTKWHMPKGSLEPGRYLTIYMSDSDAGNGLAAPFSFGSVDTGVYLYDISGALKSSIKWEKDTIGGVSVVADNTYTVYPTMGAANSTETFSSAVQTAMDGNDPVRINEVLPINKYGIVDSDGNRYGWAELYNSGSEPVSMNGYFFSDDSADLFKWAFPDEEIPSGGYMTVYLTGEKDKQLNLHASFSLSEGEKDIFLTNTLKMRVDDFPLPDKFSEDVSIGRDENGGMVYYTAPTPAEANSEGLKDPPQILRPDKNGVYISEVSAVSNAESGKNDWIELHNGSNTAVNLEGYYISDDAKDIEKWKISALSIAPEGYTVIEAAACSGGAGTADFGISPSGETLLLSDPRGTVIDAFDTGVLSPGMTSGRIESGDSTERVFFTTPTRGGPNSTEYETGYTAEPDLSETGLYHKDAFPLSITCSTSGAKIYYTTDGSVPDSGSKLYTEPLNISKNTPVRALAVADGLLPSEVKTSTFLFDAPYTMPVFCLNGNPEAMKKLLNVTYKKSYKKKDELECSTNVEYYEKDGTLGVSFESGLRPKGRASIGDPQKSFTIRLRSDYGQKEVTYPFFPGFPITTFTTLTLRNSGQDFEYARMRDSYFQNVAQGLDLDTIKTGFAIVYVNGKYNGLYDLNEEQNPDYLNSHYGLKKDNIDIIKRNGVTLCGDNKEFLRIMDMAKTMDMSDDKNFAEFSEYIDVDAFTDFLAFQTYFGNGDVLNLRYWRAQDYSVKWRPLLYDLDWSLKFDEKTWNVFGTYFTTRSKAGDGSISDMYIFNALKENKGWCEKFIERYVQLAETQFDPGRIMTIFNTMINTMTPEMPKHIAKYKTPYSMTWWRRHTGELKAAIEQRQPVALKQLQNYFNISDEDMQKLIQEYSPEVQ